MRPARSLPALERSILKVALDIVLLSAALLFCPLTTAYIADRKGRGAVPWALIGLFLGIFGILLALIVPRSSSVSAEASQL
jgi:hypothetical protein